MSTPDKSKRRPRTPASKTPAAKTPASTKAPPKGKEAPKATTSTKSVKSGQQSTKSKKGKKNCSKCSQKTLKKKGANSEQHKHSTLPKKSPATPKSAQKSVKSVKGGPAKKAPAKPPAKPVTEAAAKKAKNDEKHQQLQNIFAERHKEKQQKKMAERPPEDNEKTCMEDEEDTPETMEKAVRILEIFKHNNWLETALLQRDNEKLENFFAGDVANATMEIVLLIEQALERALGLLFMGLDYGLPSDLRKFALHDRIQLRLLNAILTHKQYLPQSWGGRIVLLTEENAKNDDGVPLLLAIETGAPPVVETEEVKVEAGVKDGKLEEKKEGESADDLRPQLQTGEQPPQQQQAVSSVYLPTY